MAQPRIGQRVVVDVPATTANLGPGFDCLGAALDLNNRFAMRRIEGGGERFELIIEGSEGSHLRGGPENLVYRAAQRVWKAAGLEPVALEAHKLVAVREPIPHDRPDLPRANVGAPAKAPHTEAGLVKRCTNNVGLAQPPSLRGLRMILFGLEAAGVL